MFHVEPSSRGAEQHSNLDGQPAWIPPITISSRTEHGLLVANSLPSMERRVWWVLCSDVSRGTFLAGCGAAFQSRRSASVDSTNYDQLPHGARVAGGELPAIDGAACLVGAVLRCFTWNLPRGVRSSIPISTVSQRGFHQLRSAPARSTGCWWRTPCHRWSGVSGGCCAPMFHVEPSSRGAEQHSNLDGQPAWIPPITISSRTEHGLLVANSLPSMERRVWWVLCSDVSRGTFLAGCGAAFQSRRSASVDSTNYDQLPHGARVAGGELPAIDGAACLVGAVLRCFTWNIHTYDFPVCARRQKPGPESECFT
jgi:hypothetical protein